MARGSNNQNLKEICVLGSEMTDELRFHKLCLHSQAELNMVNGCLVLSIESTL